MQHISVSKSLIKTNPRDIISCSKYSPESDRGIWLIKLDQDIFARKSVECHRFQLKMKNENNFRGATNTHGGFLDSTNWKDQEECED